MSAYKVAYLWPRLHSPNAFAELVITLLPVERALSFITFITMCVVRKSADNIPLLNCRVSTNTPRSLTKRPGSYHPTRTLFLSTRLKGVGNLKSCIFTQSIVNTLSCVVQFHHAVNRTSLKWKNRYERTILLSNPINLPLVLPRDRKSVNIPTTVLSSIRIEGPFYHHVLGGLHLRWLLKIYR